MFLGDGGSMLLGTLVTTYALNILGQDYNFKEHHQINKTLFSVLVLLYPLFDLFRVFVLRLKSGKSPFVADQRHLHHIVLQWTTNHFITLIMILFAYFVIFLLFFCF